MKEVMFYEQEERRAGTLLALLFYCLIRGG